EGFLTTLKKSLTEKKTTIAQIDAACKRILEAKYKLGLFDDPFRYCNADRAKAEVLSADKRMAAREFAQRSAVLLKNDRGTLPLKKTGTIALIGPLANNTSNMLGTWAVSGDASTSIPVLQGIKAVGGNGINIVYAKGANLTDDSLLVKGANVFGERVSIDAMTPDSLLSQAVAVASSADVIVAVVGEASEFTGEAASRSDISLPLSQRRLLEELSKTGKPLVVVLMSGRPLTIEKESLLATSLLQVWFGGHEAGNAIADVLFGGYNPSGKLTMSWPRNVGQVPLYYNHKNTGRPQDDTKPTQKFQSNYLDVANTPLYAFGYGLSYTTFSYSPVQLSKASMRSAEKITATVTVTNSGAYDGEEVVQLYIRDMVASVTRPVKELKDFKKIMLRKGESRQVSFTIDEEKLKFWNGDLRWVSEAGAFKAFIGGTSDNVKEADFSLLK
ncbi:MAG TPA: glycoside hydrolase family 3 C-terminal domain-containing protein, partial [Flavisolibacter sp.]|nr:glycoside hydrolase family 3 C-terminal domain-containing protein [Flavisolibacter sp.]